MKRRSSRYSNAGHAGAASRTESWQSRPTQLWALALPLLAVGCTTFEPGGGEQPSESTATPSTIEPRAIARINHAAGGSNLDADAAVEMDSYDPEDVGERVWSTQSAVTTGHGISYHGGHVMSGDIPVYFIWYGNWTNNSATTILPEFVQALRASPLYNLNTFYDDKYGGRVSGLVHYAGEVTVTGYPKGTSLEGTEVRDLVAAAVTTGGLPRDANAIYFVLSSPDVTETGFCTDHCGWHNFTTVSNTSIKYSFVGNPSSLCASACESQTASSPNGNPGADGMASIILHELEETATDPLLNAWWGTAAHAGDENADACAWTFGTEYAAPNGSRANVHLGNRDYLVQSNWVNDGLGYCGTGVFLLIGLGSDKCLDVPNAATTNGTQLEIYDCTGGPEQVWMMDNSGSLHGFGSDRCLDVVGFGTGNGSRLQIWDCNGTSNQLWTMNPQGWLRGVGSNRCLDVLGAGTANLTPVQIWDCLGTSNQIWRRF